MARKEYNNTYADYVKIKFICNCRGIVETELIPVRCHIDTNKDVNAFSHDKPIICPKCHRQHIVSFYDRLIDAYCEIPTLSDDNIVYVHEIPYEYTNGFDNSFVDYITEIAKLKDFMEQSKYIDVNDKSTLYKMGLTYAISIMDAFLGNTFRFYVNRFNLFKKNYSQYCAGNKKLHTKSILKSFEQKSFQNLEFIAIPYYSNVLGIQIPHNEMIQNALHIRNNIIHNNGREKDGYEHIVSESDVMKLIEEISRLIKYVHLSVHEVYFEKVILPNIINRKDI